MKTEEIVILLKVIVKKETWKKTLKVWENEWNVHRSQVSTYVDINSKRHDKLVKIQGCVILKGYFWKYPKNSNEDT